MRLAQFPLGTVLFPTMALPLQVFEPRYHQMMDDVMAGDRRFGVVLIERGAEAGGGDDRYPVGTVAEVVDLREAPGRRKTLLAVGTERFRVTDWLPDDPYPQAEVELWPDEPVPFNGADTGSVADKVFDLTRRVAMANGRQLEVPPLSEEPATASMQLSTLVPVGTFDRYRLLCCPSTVERLSLLEQLAAEGQELLNLLDEA